MIRRPFAPHPAALCGPTAGFFTPPRLYRTPPPRTRLYLSSPLPVACLKPAILAGFQTGGPTAGTAFANVTERSDSKSSFAFVVISALFDPAPFKLTTPFTA